MINYSKDPMDRIADAIEKLAGGSSPDEPTTTGVEIYSGKVDMFDTSLGIGFLVTFEQPEFPEYSKFVVPMFMYGGTIDPGSTKTLRELAFFKKVDDATGNVSYVTFFYVDEDGQSPIRVDVSGDIAIEANVLYDRFVALEVSRIPEEEEVSIKISLQLG